MDRHASRLRTLGVFLRAALVYWAVVWPRTHRIVGRLRAQAALIDDPLRRAAALANLDAERGNLEGAAAFAVLAPARRRRRLLTALVTFQAIYDYVDTLVEQPAADAGEQRTRRLHLALGDALAPPSQTLTHDDSDRYLLGLVETCRRAVAGLEGAPAVRARALAAVAGMVEYQVRNHEPEPAARLVRWRHAQPVAREGYLWWEAAASAASSLVVFALLARAAAGSVSERDADAIVRAYVPVGALHVLLDSDADRDADARSGDHSLIAHYRDAAAESRRLARLAAQARDGLAPLPGAATHLLIVSAMASFYLHRGDARRPTSRGIARALGPSARAADAVLRARRLLISRLTGFSAAGSRDRRAFPAFPWRRRPRRSHRRLARPTGSRRR